MLFRRRKNYFPVSELACKCGCGISNFDDKLLSILNKVRHEYGKPIILNSAVRCIIHNLNEHGSPTSSHIGNGKICTAVDIRCNNDADRWVLIDLLKKYGIKRIGIRKDFIHVDIDPIKNKKRMWVY